MRRPSSLFLGIFLAALGSLSSGTASGGEKSGAGSDPKRQEKGSKEAQPDRPPFEELLRLNAKALFGGNLKLEGESFEVSFNAAGHMAAGFQGQNIIDEKHPMGQGANRRFYAGKDEKPIENFACIGLSNAAAMTAWISRFPVGGDTKIRFNFRIPNLLTLQSGFMVQLNKERSTWIEVDFFTVIKKYAGGNKIGEKPTGLKEYAGPASKWFPRKEVAGVPVEISTVGGKTVVTVLGKEVVSLDKTGDISHGKVAFLFRKIVFTLQDLRISGKLDKAWCEEELKALEKAGKLVLKAPEEKKEEPPPASPGDPAAPAGEKKAGGGKEGKDDGEGDL